MQPYKINVQKPPSNVWLGSIGEDQQRCIVFDCTGWLADCENGSTARSYDLHTQELFLDLPESYRPRSIYLTLEGSNYASMEVYADCTNTLKVLEDAGLLEMVKAYRQSQALG